MEIVLLKTLKKKLSIMFLRKKKRENGQEYGKGGNNDQRYLKYEIQRISTRNTTMVVSNQNLKEKFS